MIATVKNVAASVKLRYEIEESLLKRGAIGYSENIYVDRWVLGTIEDASEAILEELNTRSNDDLVFFAVVPKSLDSYERPQEPQEEPKQVSQVPEVHLEDSEGSESLTGDEAEELRKRVISLAKENAELHKLVMKYL